MRFLEATHLLDLPDTFFSLLAAFVLGAVIGFERQLRQRVAGLRTNVLVAVGAAAFVDVGMSVFGDEGAARVISYVVSGVGFLGAGAIMKDGANVRGLNTAATLWASAAVGAYAGSDMLAQAVILTCFVLAGNVVLRSLLDYINRRPIDQTVTELAYAIHTTCVRDHLADLRRLLLEELAEHQIPLKRLEINELGEEGVELVAHLYPNTTREADLAPILEHLTASQLTLAAYWDTESAE